MSEEEKPMEGELDGMGPGNSEDGPVEIPKEA